MSSLNSKNGVSFLDSRKSHPSDSRKGHSLDSRKSVIPRQTKRECHPERSLARFFRARRSRRICGSIFSKGSQPSESTQNRSRLSRKNLSNPESGKHHKPFNLNVPISYASPARIKKRTRTSRSAASRINFSKMPSRSVLQRSYSAQFPKGYPLLERASQRRTSPRKKIPSF
jgi:hypothetical protein